jgi:hypothetical protein
MKIQKKNCIILFCCAIQINIFGRIVVAALCLCIILFSSAGLHNFEL